MQALHFPRAETGLTRADLGRHRPWQESPDGDRRRPAFAGDVGTQDRERIGMPPLDQGVHVRDRQRPADRRGTHGFDCTWTGPAAAARILRSMSHWSFVLGAYALVFGTLFAYWWRVERGIRTLERRAEDPPARARP